MRFQSETGKKKQTRKDDLRDFLIRLTVTAAAVLFVWKYVMAAEINWGNSMYPKVCDGDLVIYSIWNREEIYPEDVLVYDSQEGIRCGRVTARGGDVIEITDSGIYVNGALLSEQAVYDTLPESMTLESPYTVPEGTVFLMNDYRSDNSDSRMFGAVDLSEVRGRLFLVIRRRGF